MSKQCRNTTIPIGLDIMSLFPAVLLATEQTIIDRTAPENGHKADQLREGIRKLKDTLNEQQTSHSQIE